MKKVIKIIAIIILIIGILIGGLLTVKTVSNSNTVAKIIVPTSGDDVLVKTVDDTGLLLATSDEEDIDFYLSDEKGQQITFKICPPSGVNFMMDFLLSPEGREIVDVIEQDTVYGLEHMIAGFLQEDGSYKYLAYIRIPDMNFAGYTTTDIYDIEVLHRCFKSLRIEPEGFFVNTLYWFINREK